MSMWKMVFSQLLSEPDVNSDVNLANRKIWLLEQTQHAHTTFCVDYFHPCLLLLAEEQNRK